MPNATGIVNSKVMDSAQNSKGKLALFAMWLRAGAVKVFFDSGFVGVRIVDRLKNDPEMWVVLVESRVSDDGFIANIRSPTDEMFEVYVPWGAVHTMESAAFDEVHVWATDLRAAEERKESGYLKEMKN